MVTSRGFLEVWAVFERSLEIVEWFTTSCGRRSDVMIDNIKAGRGYGCAEQGREASW